MNSFEAKQILTAYRPGSSDERDPEVIQALSFVRAQAELALWLEQQIAFHRAVRGGFEAIPVPSGLKARILTQQKTIVPLWQRPAFLLAAACLVAAFVLVALQFRRPSEDLTFDGFRARMIGFAQRVYGMDIVTNDLQQIRQYLARKGAPADYALTAGLQTMPAKGGAYLSWQSKPVSMVCFELPKDDTLYMFVMDEAKIPAGPVPGPAAKIETVQGITTASWSMGGKVYLLAAHDPEVLRRSAPGGR